MMYSNTTHPDTAFPPEMEDRAVNATNAKVLLIVSMQKYALNAKSVEALLFVNIG